MLVLGIESSCDETAAALVRDGREMVSSVISSQVETHRRFGGVVPELASREHLDKIVPVVEEAFARADVRKKQIDGIAVTAGPGLVGSLLVGVSYAKAMAYALGKPLVGINHIEGHVYSVVFDNPPVQYPAFALIVSGGHTNLFLVPEPGKYKVLARTRDDAAGEAFDKGARLLGLGYPGGAEIDRLAQEGDRDGFSFPVARVPGLDFSFSGLKTALLYKIRELGDDETGRRKLDLAASYQHAIVRALTAKLHDAAEQTGLQRLAVVGGVSANSALRAALQSARFAPLHLCTDNAAMIASAARYIEPIPHPLYLGLDAYASIA